MPKIGALSRVILEALGIVGICGGTALAVNALRPTGGLPLVRRSAYQILVPCPEVGGEVEGVPATTPWASEATTLVVDARSREAYARWHWPSARSLVFDYLSPVADGDLQWMAASRAKRVLVYGDGDNPDSGMELARLLSASGIRNVFFVEGGARGLCERSGKETCP
jgi:hypothetical protein